MSTKELSRVEVMGRLQEKRLTQKEAGKILWISERQVKRLWKQYRKKGVSGLVSKRRGRPSNNRLAGETVQSALDWLHSRYADFGPTLACEKLVEVHGLKLSVGSADAGRYGKVDGADMLSKLPGYFFPEGRFLVAVGDDPSLHCFGFHVKSFGILSYLSNSKINRLKTGKS